MSRQVTQNSIQNKNEEEISKNKVYADTYRKMISQMAKNSQDENM